MNFKTRMIISILLLLLVSIALPLLIIFVQRFSPPIYVFSYVLLLIGIGTFFWAGLTKIIITITYIFLTILFLYTFPEYDLPIVITGSILFLFNPYKFIETIFSKNLKTDRENNLYKMVRKKNQQYFLYHQDMKKFYYLPNYILLYKNKFYKLIRYTIPAILYGAASFFSFYRLKSFINFANSIKYYDNLMFWFISVIVILITALFIQYKGFKSAVRFILIFIFPYLFYIIFHMATFPKNDLLIKYFILAGCIIGLFVVIIVQIPYYYQRVIYYSYSYFDNKNNLDVYANGVYEKYIYHKGHQRHGIYLLNTNLLDFQEKFKWLLIYANYHHIIITSYTYKAGELKLYCAFRTDKKKQPNRLLKYLSKLYKNKNIILTSFVDQDALYYPEKFSNTDNYIIARAIKEANVLKDFGLNKNIILSLFINFDEHKNMVEFAREKQINIYDLSNYKALAEVRVELKNDANQIELVLRDILSSLYFHNGKFLKVVIRYSVEKVNKYLLN